MVHLSLTRQQRIALAFLYRMKSYSPSKTRCLRPALCLGAYNMPRKTFMPGLDCNPPTTPSSIDTACTPLPTEVPFNEQPLLALLDTPVHQLTNEQLTQFTQELQRLRIPQALKAAVVRSAAAPAPKQKAAVSAAVTAAIDSL